MVINKKIINNLLPFFVLLLCLAFLYKGQLFILKPTFFNFEGTYDIRAHISKIELIRQSIVNKTGWPSWSNSTYLGYAPFQYYPPLFYVIGGLLAVVFSSFTSYKLLVLLNFIFSVFSFAFFVRRATNIPQLWARWTGVVFSLSPPLLNLHLYGTEPNLMAWSTASLVLGFYCWPKDKSDYIWAILWFTATILIHPYPTLFLGIILLTWTIVESIINKPWYKPLINLIGLVVPAAILTIWWWLPAFLTKDYLSPLADPFVWSNHNSFIVHIILLIAVLLYFRNYIFFKKQSVVFIGLFWSVFLAWGGQKFIPLLGDFLHSIRFANLGMVSFSLAIIILVFYNNRSQLISFRRPYKNSVLIGVLFVILALFTFDSFINGELSNFHKAEFINFERNNNFDFLFTLLEGKRVVITPRIGGLGGANSLVTYAPFYNFQSVTGAYNQGDPKFFNFTVHLEWEERWLFHRQTLENLMGAAATDYLYINDPGKFWFFKKIASFDDNSKLLSSPIQVSSVALTAPALLDVGANDVQLFTDIINLLLPDGYQLPLVNVAEIDESEINLFPLVVSHSENVLLKYPRAKAYLIINNSIAPDSLSDSRVYFINLDKESMRKYFYQGDNKYYNDWINFDLAADKANYIQHSLDLLESSNEAWISFKNNNMISESVLAQINNKNIIINITPKSFVVIRQSWFPRWVAKQGRVWPTTQGFMLGYAPAGQIELEFLNTWRFIKKNITFKELLSVN